MLDLEKILQILIENKVELYGKKCRVLDIDALIVSKKALGKPKDNQVVIQLEAIKEGLDKS